MVEAIVAMVMMFGTGYGVRWYNEPECQEIVFVAPKEVTEGIWVEDCKEDSPTTVCSTPYPRFVLAEEEYRKDIENGKATRAYLNECVRVIEKYNDVRK